MSDLNSTVIDGFSAAVSSGAGEAASAFERTFGTKIEIRAGSGSPLDLGVLNPKISEKGLVLSLYWDGKGIGILIPSSSGLIPDWCENPDATGKSKLATFAQEWGMNLVPEDFFPEDFKAALVGDLQYSLQQAQPGEQAAVLEILLKTTHDVPVYLVWPLQEPNGLLLSAEPEALLPPPPQIVGGGTGQFDAFAPVEFGPRQGKRVSLDDLPGYGRSSLKVRVPVATVLARARKPIKAILELGIGSVIQFDKSCDEPLEIEVGQCVVIADAEAVKVGDKFGFRINSILLPKERFRRVEVRREGEYRAKQNLPQIIGKAPIKSLVPTDGEPVLRQPNR